ncbi:hypothetical protein CKO45_18870 [Paracraurococcus ruber]|uniref:DNA-3-methyladenine glycosylase 2 family protein n=1 Tax=Paracraurococcus ruber TaxID=77675 RepID=A0ABS1D1I0_9PROT|nr:hypothetical protein [Paracraurococcus ruber]
MTVVDPRRAWATADRFPGITLIHEWTDDAMAALAPDSRTAVKGLGRWTAEIHLLFAEQRPDVFPSGDLALAASAAHLLGLPARPGPKDLAAIALGWAPWRSLAARLLWHHWRFVTGRPVVEDG